MATSKFIKYFQTTAGEPVINAAIWLVPQSNSYPTGALALTAHATRDGSYYRDAVPDGEYKIYIDVAGGSSPSLYDEHIWVGEQRVTEIADHFDAADAYKLKASGLKDQTKTVVSVTNPTPDYIGQPGADASGNRYVSIALSGTMWKRIESYANANNREITLLRDLISFESNMFDKSKITLDYYISGSSGNPVSSAGWWHSDYIPIKPSTTYSSNRNFKDRAFYDADKKFISGASTSVSSFTTPSNAVYVRFSDYSTTSFSTFNMIESATPPTYYRPYKRLINYSIDKYNDVAGSMVRIFDVFKGTAVLKSMDTPVCRTLNPDTFTGWKYPLQFNGSAFRVVETQVKADKANHKVLGYIFDDSSNILARATTYTSISGDTAQTLLFVFDKEINTELLGSSSAIFWFGFESHDHSAQINDSGASTGSAYNLYIDATHKNRYAIKTHGLEFTQSFEVTPGGNPYLRFYTDKSIADFGSKVSDAMDTLLEVDSISKLQLIMNQFGYSYTQDSFTSTLTPSSVNSGNAYTYEFKGWGADFTKAGVSFNMLYLKNIKRTTTAPFDDTYKWKYIQLYVKNDKTDATPVAISPLIEVDPELDTLTDLYFPLMDTALENFVTLDDSSFSGSTYFIGYILFNENLERASGGTQQGTQSNYAGTSWYSTNTDHTTWTTYSGNPCIPFEHLLAINIHQIATLTGDNTLAGRVTNLETIVGDDLQLQLPHHIDMVVGDTLQLYYSSLIAFPNWQKYHFAATLTGGKDLKRYVEFTPDSAGDRTLTINMYDDKSRLIDSASTTIKVYEAVQQPASTVNFWTVGDSLTNNPTYTDEMVRRLTGTGGTPSGLGFGNIVNHREGNSGKQWNWYVNDPASPFMYGGSLDFEQYRIDNSLAVPDVVYILLTWNGMGTNRTQSEWDTWDNDVYTFIDALKADFPSVQVKLVSPPYPSQNGGLGYVDGANAGGYPNTLLQNTNALKQAEIYERISFEASYSAWVEHINTALCVDSLYNIDAMDKNVNTRNSTITERIGTNDVHPNNYGYYQIGDVVFRNFIKEFCQ